MQVTIAGRDVELPEGAPLGRCRVALARLTGADELVDAVLGVDGRALDDDHPTGVPPLVHGAVLAVGGGLPDPAALAAAAPWHVAVVAGPGAGLVAAPGRDGAVRVGRAGSGTAAEPGAPPGPAGTLLLPDPGVSRRHAVVRAARRVPGRWHVADVGSANGTSVARAWWPRPLRVRRRGRLVRAGAAVAVGGSVLVVRTAPARRTRPEDGTPPGRRTRGPAGGVPRPPAPAPAAVVVPALVAVLLAAVTGSPVLLALGLAGPLAATAPALAAGLRRRRPAPLAPGDDAATAAVALARTGRLPGGPDDDVTSLAWWGWAVDGLAVLGPEARPAARALVAAAAARPGGITVTGGGAAAWAWLRHPAGASSGRLVLGSGLATPTPHLTVVDQDGTVAHPRAEHDAVRSPGGGAGREAVLVVAASRRDAPAWCRWFLEVGARGDARLHGPDGVRRLEVPLGSAAWAERHARRLAAAWSLRPPSAEVDAAGPSAVDATLPRAVGLVDLLAADAAPAEPVAVAARWVAALGRAAPLTSLAVPLAVGPGTRRGPGPAGTPPDPVVRVDLLADGPHALVAGTTGSGKSELLQSWLLGLALRHPPDHVALVLVDYKGGASFGPCVGLPHVVGLVTDLDPGAATRALAGLRAEQRRRERLLAEAGVTDLEALRARGSAPPRLVVVVDEFRALAADLPEVVTGLVDLAAQGRSLGLHLVLATQRPSGAVTPQMRANLALRVCLRVPDAADSSDVVEVPDAAALAADAPGRAVVRRDGRTEVVQTAWAALPPGTWAPPAAVGGPVVARWAPPPPTVPSTASPAAPDGPTSAAAPAGAATAPGAPPGTDHAGALVEVARTAAAALGRPAPARVWSPALPDVVPEHLAPQADGALVLGLRDRPEVPDQVPLRWWPGTGPLAVAGRPRSGRSTALAVLARAALARGDAVHVVGRAPAPPDHPGLGTVVGPDDPARLARLLRALLGGHPPGSGAGAGSGAGGPSGAARTLLVLDDVGAVQHALGRLPRGAGADLVERVLREGPGAGLDVALAGLPADVARHAGLCTARLVLPAEPHDDVLLGVPAALARARSVPGRAAYVGPDGAAALAQVALPGDGSLPAPGRTPPLRLLPVPAHVPGLPTAGPAAALRLPVGLGGDDSGPVTLDATRGALVVGPPGSGRSTALRAVAAAAARRGVAVLGADDAAGLARARSGDTTGAPGTLVLVDDADDVPAALDDVLAALLADGVPVVVAARTERAVAAYRGVLAALRGVGSALVLAPATPGSGELAGVDLALLVDPDRPRAPGRGVVVDRGRVEPVQVADVRPAAPGPAA